MIILCGIVGWINYDKDLSDDKQIMLNMMNTLIHRGPDESGIYCDQHVLLGHRRLIVVDPAGGKQPMEFQVGDNHFILVYNGELYNTDIVRKKLIDEGYFFRSHSDTEVLLKSYIEWGTDCVDYLNGIFRICGMG